MIEDGDADDSRGATDSLRKANVFFTRSRIAAGVIVRNDQADSVVFYGEPDDLWWAD